MKIFTKNYLPEKGQFIDYLEKEKNKQCINHTNNEQMSLF